MDNEEAGRQVRKADTTNSRREEEETRKAGGLK
jgi:hypothetical protein